MNLSYSILFYFLPFCSRSIYVPDVVLHLVLTFMVNDGFKGSFRDGSLDVITSAFLMLAGCIVLFSISLFIIVSILKTM